MLDRFHVLGDHSSVPVTASQTSGAQNWFDTGVNNDFGGGQLGRAGALELELTADPTGTNPTIQLVAQDAVDNGSGSPGSFYNLLASPVYTPGGAAPTPAKQAAVAKTTNLKRGDKITLPLPPGCGRHLSYQIVVGGTTPSFACKVYLRAM